MLILRFLKLLYIFCVFDFYKLLLLLLILEIKVLVVILCLFDVFLNIKDKSLFCF